MLETVNSTEILHNSKTFVDLKIMTLVLYCINKHMFGW